MIFLRPLSCPILLLYSPPQSTRASGVGRMVLLDHYAIVVVFVEIADLEMMRLGMKIEYMAI